jgi:sec-independent protein translocase protein TatC
MYVGLSVVIFAGLAYSVERQIINWLLAPAHHQSFIYTSPLDGINFVFKVCLYVGIAFSLPVIIYQVLKYIEPIFSRGLSKYIYNWTAVSVLLAAVGIIFGYFVGLPAVLSFLLHQFHTNQIHPLLTIDEYLSFVLVYMLAATLMFQLPLVILFINRVHPLQPRKLIHYERWVILASLIWSAVMNPTTNIIALFLIAVPVVITYQLGIGIIWWQNRYGRRQRILRLLEADALKQAERIKQAGQLIFEPGLLGGDVRIINRSARPVSRVPSVPGYSRSYRIYN